MGAAAVFLGFQLLADAGAEEGEPVRDAKLLPAVGRRAQQRALHRHKQRDQLWLAMLNVGHDHRTGRGNTAPEILLPDVLQIRPGADVRAEGHGDQPPHAQRLESAQNRGIFLRIRRQKRGRDEQRDRLSVMKIIKKRRRIILVISRAMLTFCEACPAGNAARGVDMHRGGFPIDGQIACPRRGTYLHALVAADTFFICVDQTLLLHVHPSICRGVPAAFLSDALSD